MNKHSPDLPLLKDGFILFRRGQEWGRIRADQVAELYVGHSGPDAYVDVVTSSGGSVQVPAADPEDAARRIAELCHLDRLQVHSIERVRAELGAATVQLGELVHAVQHAARALGAP